MAIENSRQSVQALMDKSYDKEQYFLDNKRKLIDEHRKSQPTWENTMKK